MDLRRKIAAFPEKPGIYFFKDAAGLVIYIGKARRLRDRVKSYFQPSDDIKVGNILAETVDVDYILTGSEREAAFLENNFIQQHQPKFNLRLKDDKSFPYLKLTIQERFPGIFFCRQVAPDGAKYFGPFSPAREARKALHLVNKYFLIRKCDEAIPGKRRRPCLDVELGLCSAPCVGHIAEERYREDVEKALLFLEGQTERLAKILKEDMARAAKEERFEEAARLRDIVTTLDAIRVKPTLISVGLENQDIFGFARDGRAAAVYVFLMRKGKVREAREFDFEDERERAEADILGEFLAAFYRDRDVPPKILLPFAPAGFEDVGSSLSAKAGKKVRLLIPVRGKNKDLIGLAAKNAEILLRKNRDDSIPLEAIRKELELDRPPVRIEGFDVSNTGGTEMVAAMVSFMNGRPDKDGYRKFKIKTVAGPNDVASLGEVLRRRYARVLAEKQPIPDLILIDGGKPQFGAARKALAALGLENVPLIALAKKEEIAFTLRRAEGLRLDPASPARKLLQRVRDEAHRFAIRYHRQRRAKRSFA